MRPRLKQDLKTRRELRWTKDDKKDLNIAKYKYFKDELAPIYEEIRGAKFADAES